MTRQQHVEPIALSIPAAVAASGRSRAALYLAMKAGQLRAKKAYKRRLILAADLRAWLEALPDANPHSNSAK